MKSNKIIYTVFLLIISIISCSKDLDFNKYNHTYSPEIITPIADAAIDAASLIQDSMFEYDADGLVRFVMAQDSIISIGADTLLDIIEIPETSFDLKLGSIEIPEIQITSEFDLNKIVSEAPDSIKNFFNSNSGSSTKFPYLSEKVLLKTNLSPINSYEYLLIMGGYLRFTIKNQLPTTIKQLNMDIYDEGHSKLLGTLNFKNIKSGEIGTDSIPTTGKLISNKFSYNFPQVIVDSTENPVLIDLNNKVSLTIASVNMRTSAGKAIIPNQTLDQTFEYFDISNPKEDYRLQWIWFDTAVLPYTVESNFSETFTTKVDFPDATIDWINPVPTRTITVTPGISDNEFDFSFHKFYLGKGLSKDNNTIRIGVSRKIENLNQMIVFDSSNTLTVKLKPAKVKVEYISGYMGNKTWDININNINLGSQLESFGKGLKLLNPKISINVANSFGIPMQVKFNITTTNTAGDQEQMNPPDIDFNYPQISEYGATKFTNFDIDNSNSNIVNTLSLPPRYVSIKAQVILNPNGFQGYNDFISNKSKIKGSLELNVPSTMTATNIRFTDTSGFRTGDPKSLEMFSKMEYMDLVIKTKNDFPFDGILDLYMTDENYVILDSIKDATLIVSGPQSGGKTVTPGINSTTLRLNQQMANLIGTAQVKHFIFKTRFNTTNNGTVPVNIYKNYLIDISLGLRGKLLNQTIRKK